MTHSPLQIQFELAYDRRVLFAVELLDAVTLDRVSQGIQVRAEGLRKSPVVNSGGLFVWLEEDFGPLRRITVDSGARPYERVEREASQVQRPLTTIELPPRIDYPFAAGITGLRGTLIESHAFSTPRPTAVPDAEILLQWLNQDGHWCEGLTATHTGTSGDFVAFLRLAPNETPDLDANGLITVRLQVSRQGIATRSSAELKIQPDRITNPTPLGPLTFAWDELMS